MLVFRGGDDGAAGIFHFPFIGIAQGKSQTFVGVIIVFAFGGFLGLKVNAVHHAFGFLAEFFFVGDGLLIFGQGTGFGDDFLQASIVTWVSGENTVVALLFFARVTRAAA